MNKNDLRIHRGLPATCLVSMLSLVSFAGVAWAEAAAQFLPKQLMLSDQPLDRPVVNVAFVPGHDAMQANPLHAIISMEQAELELNRELAQPVCDGRPTRLGGSCRGGADKRLFPAISLELFSFDADTRLGAIEIGTMVAETDTGADVKSYWQVIPQYGRVWKEPGDGDWSRAAFPIMLVHDFENVAHHGLATFLYKGNDVSHVRMQFVQQTTPWNTPEHFIAWGVAETHVESKADPRGIADLQAAATEEFNKRIEVQPWDRLKKQYPPGALDGFGGPLQDRWIVMHAAVKDGIVYYQDSDTPYGPFPYPQEMRFGIRSMTKSIAVPLALGRLSQVFGPYILDLKIGDYVDGLHPGYDEVRFIDAANMVTGMGGSGELTTEPNDGGSGYLDDTYEEWYNGAKSVAEKLELIIRGTRPYPWGPGVVYRYRDRDHHLLGMAVDGFLKTVRGPDENIWDMLEEEVFRPIGIYHAPIVRTVEQDGSKGLPWFHAGYYPLLDDVAKIGMLYQNLGRFGDEQLLHPLVMAEIFSTERAVIKGYDHSVDTAFSRETDRSRYANKELYKLAFHYTPYSDVHGTARHIPTMSGHSGTGAMFHPNGIISIRIAKAWPLPDGEQTDPYRNDTIQIISRLPR